MKLRLSHAALIACCMAVVSCGTTPTAPREAEYDVLTVKASDAMVENTYPATIKGRQDIAIYPQVSGTISTLCVNEGEVVRKGQSLFVIDQIPYRAALQTAEANVSAAKAAEATAQLTYDSKKELFARNIISQTDLQMAYNTLLTVKAQLAQAEAQRVNAANSLSHTLVKSPTNGVVGTLPYRAGALVGPTIAQPLTTVSDNSEMYIYFSVSENQLLSMTREHGSMEVALKSMPAIDLKLNDGTMYEHQGRIESISGVIDPTTGSASMRAMVPNPGRILHSGSSGNVIIRTNRKDCIVIPKGATYELQDKTFAFKIADGKASSVLINVSKNSNSKEYIVESGLTPGDVIVAEGVGLLREGTPIKAKTSASEQPVAPVADSTAVATTK